MPVRVLVTGFEAFGAMSTNPTQQMVTALAERRVPGVELHTLVLPVEFPAGFIHFPASTEMAVADPRLPSLPQEMMERALVVAVQAVVRSLRS